MQFSLVGIAGEGLLLDSEGIDPGARRSGPFRFAQSGGEILSGGLSGLPRLLVAPGDGREKLRLLLIGGALILGVPVAPARVDMINHTPQFGGADLRSGSRVGPELPQRHGREPEQGVIEIQSELSEELTEHLAPLLEAVEHLACRAPHCAQMAHGLAAALAEIACLVGGKRHNARTHPCYILYLARLTVGAYHGPSYRADAEVKSEYLFHCHYILR